MSRCSKVTPNTKLTRVPKDYRPYVKMAMAQGWTYISSKHLKLVPPAGLPDAHMIVMSGSPSDVHGLNQFRRDLVRNGVDIP